MNTTQKHLISKRVVSLALCLCVIITMFNGLIFSVSAESTDVQSGSCGTNATWSYNAINKTLTISGSGAIKNYVRNYNTSRNNTSGGYYTTAPWWDYYAEIEHLIIEEGITSIGEWCFYNFRNVKSVSLPQSLKSIKERAFHCFGGSFEKILFPDSLQEIGDYAFDGSQIQRLIIPGSVKTIPLACFHYCEKLKEVIIKDGCTRINAYAFNNCFVLSNISIPSTVKTIESYSLCRQNPPNGWYASTGYKGLCIYGENNSYAQQYALKNNIAFITLSNTGNSLELPNFSKEEYAKLLQSRIEDSQYAISFSNWTNQGHTYTELLDLTVDIPLIDNEGNVCSIKGSTTVMDLIAYLLFADVAQDYLLESIDSVRTSFRNKKAEEAYQNFLSDIKNFQSQYYYFQNKINGGDSFQQTLYSLLLAKSILTIVDNSGMKDVKYVFDLYKGSVSESPQYYDDLCYYVMSGGDTKYLNSSYASTLKGLGLTVKNSKQIISIVKSGISSGQTTSYITLGLDNLSYFAETYDFDYKDKIKKAKEEWEWADTTIGYVNAITSYSLAGTLSASWKLANAYIDEVKKIYTNEGSTDAGWYALTYYYLLGNNKELLNGLIDQNTGSAAFGIDRIAQYGIPYDKNDIIEKNIVNYWNKKAYINYSYTPNERMRFYLWKACNAANAIMGMNVEDYYNIMLQYILAEINYKNGDVGVDRTITVTANDKSLGNVSGAGQYSFGSKVTLTATPYDNVQFAGWKDLLNNKIVSTNRSYSFILNEDVKIQALFLAGNARHAQSPAIISQPLDVVAEKGQTEKLLNINAQSQDGGKIIVSWYRNENNNTNGGLFMAKGNSLPLDTSDVGTHYYYAIVTNELTDYIGSNEIITTVSVYSNIAKVTVNKPFISGLSIEHLPSKLSYKIGEEIDTSDMVVVLNYSDGTRTQIDNYSLKYDFSASGQQEVVVYMLNYRDKFYVTCEKCDYTTYEECPALGHNYIDHAAKPATCQEIGWDAYQTCLRCDYSTYAEIAALGHDYINHEAKEPTDTEIGWKAYETCSRCDYTTYEEIPAVKPEVNPEADLDGDGSIMVKDALMLISAVLNNQSLEKGDMNGDGKLSLVDVLLILKLIAK